MVGCRAAKQCNGIRWQGMHGLGSVVWYGREGIVLYGMVYHGMIGKVLCCMVLLGRGLCWILQGVFLSLYEIPYSNFFSQILFI